MSDTEQFTLLFQQHYGRVLAFAARRSDPARAQDVAAETFTVAWRHFARLPAEPLPWLYRTARNCLLNQERARTRQSRLTLRLAGTPTPSVPDHAISVVEDVGLRSALARLSPTERETLMLVSWEELDHAAAAQVMECSVTAFAVRLHRARKKLGRYLSEGEPGRSRSTGSLIDDAMPVSREGI